MNKHIKHLVALCNARIAYCKNMQEMHADARKSGNTKDLHRFYRENFDLRMPIGFPEDILLSIEKIQEIRIYYYDKICQDLLDNKSTITDKINRIPSSVDRFKKFEKDHFERYKNIFEDGNKEGLYTKHASSRWRLGVKSIGITQAKLENVFFSESDLIDEISQTLEILKAQGETSGLTEKKAVAENESLTDSSKPKNKNKKNKNKKKKLAAKAAAGKVGLGLGAGQSSLQGGSAGDTKQLADSVTVDTGGKETTSVRKESRTESLSDIVSKSADGTDNASTAGSAIDAAAELKKSYDVRHEAKKFGEAKLTADSSDGPKGHAPKAIMFSQGAVAASASQIKPNPELTLLDKKRLALEKMLKKHKETLTQVFTDNFLHYSLAFTELENAVKAVGGKIVKKSGSSRRIELNNPFVEGGHAELLYTYTNEPIFDVKEAKEASEEVKASRGSRPAPDRKHKPGHAIKMVCREVALQFRRAFLDAGIDARILWPEEFVEKKPEVKKQR